MRAVPSDPKTGWLRADHGNRGTWLPSEGNLSGGQTRTGRYLGIMVDIADLNRLQARRELKIPCTPGK